MPNAESANIENLKQIISVGCQSADDSLSTTDLNTPTIVPKFVSRGHLYKAIVGDTIELPCKVQNLGKAPPICLSYS